MARVACRYPGGINLHIKKTGVPVERWPQHRLNGPPGRISVPGNPLRSPKAASELHLAHRGKLREMELSKDKPLHEMDYVENDVPDHFWHAWLAQQGETHTHLHKVVFELESPPVVAPVFEPSPPVRARNGRPSEIA